MLPIEVYSKIENELKRHINKTGNQRRFSGQISHIKEIQMRTNVARAIEKNLWKAGTGLFIWFFRNFRKYSNKNKILFPKLKGYSDSKNCLRIVFILYNSAR